MSEPRVGCFPGSFDPPTVAHLAVAEAARAAAGLTRVDLVLSRQPLGKAAPDDDAFAARCAVLAAVAETRPWLGVRVSPHRLIVDVAAGYDAVVLGADKWRQVVDPAWYGDDPTVRDRAVAALPLVVVAARGDDDLPDLHGDLDRGFDRRRGAGSVIRVTVDPALRAVNASAVRAGRPEAAGWALPEAAGSRGRAYEKPR